MLNFKPSGGGGKGGKRSNAGRKIALKIPDWKKYKPVGKKRCDSLVKCNKRVDEFFKKKVISDNEAHRVLTKDSEDDCCITAENKDRMEIDSVKFKSEFVNVIEHCVDLTEANFSIPYFQNGSLAPLGEKRSKDNYTCAPDAIYFLGESLILNNSSPNCIDKVKKCPIMSNILQILTWRIKNQFQWNHGLRNSLWDTLADLFPKEFTPIGRVDAILEPAVLMIEQIWPINVHLWNDELYR